MSQFFDTSTSVKHPMKDVAPFLQTGTGLGYGLKIYRGYCVVTDTDDEQFLYKTDGSGERLKILQNSAIVAGSIKAATPTLTNIVTFGLNIVNFFAAASTICSGISLANVNLGVGFTYGALSGAVSTAPVCTSTNNYVYPMLTSTGGTASTATTVYVTLLVMEISP